MTGLTLTTLSLPQLPLSFASPAHTRRQARRGCDDATAVPRGDDAMMGRRRLRYQPRRCGGGAGACTARQAGQSIAGDGSRPMAVTQAHLQEARAAAARGHAAWAGESFALRSRGQIWKVI